MAGNPVLGFLTPVPTGTGAHSKVATALRFLGIAVLVGAAVSVLSSVLTLTAADLYSATPAGDAFEAAVTGMVIASMVFGLAIAAAICFWITFTYNAWNRWERRASTHALVLGILAVVFGGLGVLGGLFGTLVGTAFYTEGATTMYMALGLVSVLVSAAELGCGIMVLVNRGPATSAGTPSSGASWS